MEKIKARNNETDLFQLLSSVLDLIVSGCRKASILIHELLS